MGVSSALKITLLLENPADSRGVATEKWYVPTPGTDVASRALMRKLAQQRAAVMADSCQVREARGEVVSFDANGKPIRGYQLGSVGLATGGFPSGGTFFGDRLSNLSPGRNSAPTAVLAYGMGTQANFRYTGLAFSPAAASRDLLVLADSALVRAQPGYTQWSKAAGVYYAALIAAGAFQVTRLEPGAKAKIIAVTSGSRNPPTLATVVLAGDRTADYLTVPNTPVQVMDRRARRGLGTSKFRELNGIHGVMSATYAATPNMTTLTLTCTLDTDTDLCRTPGFARPVQWTQLSLSDYDLFAAVRGRRGRKNVVQI